MEPVCIGLDQHQRPIKRIASKTLLSEMTQVFKENENIYSLTLCQANDEEPCGKRKGTKKEVWTMDRLVCGC